MLILAGVAISAVIDSEGLFSKTKAGAELYNNAIKDENATLSNLMNYIDRYLLGGVTNPDGDDELEDTTALETAKIEVSDLDATLFTLKATASNINNEITKYEFYIDGNLANTIETSKSTVEYNVTEKERNTQYECMVRIYTIDGRYFDSEVVDVKTDIIATGDFVNYSVVVDEVEYKKWRILHKDLNGHMEIVCYNGPEYILGSFENDEKAKSDYANCIYLLNEASNGYNQGTFGYGTRHLGSNPTNPSAYANISEEYIYCGVEDNEYIIQEHHGTDMKSIEKFSGEKKLYAIYTWLASRWVNIIISDEGIEEFGFRARCIGSDGALNSKYFYRIDSLGNKVLGSQYYALAPVVLLEEGVKINIDASGMGTEDNPWELVKN